MTLIRHSEITDAEVQKMIRKGVIKYGGNSETKIYGMLNCYFGRRMKRNKRIFFSSVAEAQEMGFKPCWHCIIRQNQRKKE